MFSARIMWKTNHFQLRINAGNVAWLRNPRISLFCSKSMKELPVLTLYTKDQCSLCDEALEELQPFKHRFLLEKVDITLPNNREWFKKYKYEIPVFHFNGKFLMKNRVDKSLVEKNWSSLKKERMKKLP